MWIWTEDNKTLINTFNIGSIVAQEHPDFDGRWRVRAYGVGAQAYNLHGGTEEACKSFAQGLYFKLEERETRQALALELIADRLVTVVEA